jgi:hypothetical protein
MDSSVLLGMRFEYWFTKNGTPAAKNVLTAGLQAPLVDARGSLVLLVDASKVAALGARLDRLVEDLVGDGWQVLRHDVAPTASVPSVKALIAADVAANPLAVKAVFLLGRVPVPYSGSLAPDGHPDHQGAWPADVYYGELQGPWTDTSVNTTVASRLENRNVPGDGKFDQTAIPSDVDLAVGRVDFANLPAFAASETQLLQQYLDKDHDYRHKVFAVDQRAVIDDNFGWFSGEAFAASGFRNFSGAGRPGQHHQRRLLRDAEHGERQRLRLVVRLRRRHLHECRRRRLDGRLHHEPEPRRVHHAVRQLLRRLGLDRQLPARAARLGLDADQRVGRPAALVVPRRWGSARPSAPRRARARTTR